MCFSLLTLQTNCTVIHGSNEDPCLVEVVLYPGLLGNAGLGTPQSNW